MMRETNGGTSQYASSQNTKEAKVTRPLGPFTYEQLLEQDITSAKRTRDEDKEWISEPTIVLGIPKIKSIRVSSLGPILKRRFVHPGLE